MPSSHASSSTPSNPSFSPSHTPINNTSPITSPISHPSTPHYQQSTSSSKARHNSLVPSYFRLADNNQHFMITPVRTNSLKPKKSIKLASNQDIEPQNTLKRLITLVGKTQCRLNMMHS